MRLILTLSVTISPVWAINRVLRLDGYGDYVSIPDWSELRGGPDVVKTIEAMFNAENSTVSEKKSIGGAIVGKALDGAQKDWVIQIRDGKIRYSGEVFRGDYTLSGPDVTANVWYHVAVILD